MLNAVTGKVFSTLRAADILVMCSGVAEFNPDLSNYWPCLPRIEWPINEPEMPLPNRY